MITLKKEQDGKLYIYAESDDRRWEERSWAKLIKGVDMEKNNGYALQGEFIPMAKGKNRVYRPFEVQEGDVILDVQDVGSRQYHRQIARIYRIEEGELKEYGKFDYRSEFISLKIKLKELLDKPVDVLKETLKRLIEEYSLAEVEKKINEIKKEAGK